MSRAAANYQLCLHEVKNLRAEVQRLAAALDKVTAELHALQEHERERDRLGAEK